MNIVDLATAAKNNFGSRTAYSFKGQDITFDEVYEKALAFADVISRSVDEREPVVVISDKNLLIPSVYVGIAMSNCFYVPVSCEMPKNKIDAILVHTKAKLILCDGGNRALVDSLEFGGKVITIEEAAKTSHSASVPERSRHLLDTDPLYVIFTSGSTGVPKGVVTSHASVMDYVQAFAKTFDFSRDEILGNQAPLDYIAAIRDIYIPMLVGCRSVFIPKTLFSTPKLLFEYVNSNKVTTICWVSAALALCCQFNVFEQIKPQFVRKVFFTGSVLDPKHLNAWVKALPDATFVNHYGPTEITASCTYYVVDNSITYEANLPIGRPFVNRRVFVLKDGRAADVNEIGEICVTGQCLALGYYNNPEVTAKNFIQNPLNPLFPERMYLTGDLGYMAPDDNLMFVGRKDNQIKHMGHRVELGEIEDFSTRCAGVDEACCVYNSVKSVITLFYVGDATAGELAKSLRANLPSFMIPRKLIKLDALPRLYNGKVDRQECIRRANEPL